MNQELETKMNKPETRSRKFWRVVLGSMLGFFLSTLIASFLYILMLIGMIGAIAASSDDTTVIGNNTILKLDFTQQITERTVSTPFDNMGDYNTLVGLNDILASIKAAADDPKIEGIYLCAAQVFASPATLKEIRDALVTFKKSGKFIYAYSDGYMQNGYYLASAADKIVLNPTGNLMLKGYAFQVMFYKGLLDKMDVDVQIIRHGKFKSAVEPYMLDKMSDANREQYTLLANSLWKCMSEDIAAARKITVDKLNVLVDDMTCFNPDSALKYKLIDKLLYAADMEKMLKSKVGVGENDKLQFVSLSKYARTVKKEQKSEDKVAVFYAYGNIKDGKGDSDSGIYSDSFVKAFRKMCKDDKVKAIVLRVNSPGGSALASENIWQEIERAKKAGKIVVTSMGDYAASGGYYIACNSDYIIAQPNTLTGSIGVFGMIPSFQRAMKNKLGITVDAVTTHHHSDFLSGYGTMDEAELALMQQQVERTYGLFTKRVADGRKMTVAAVDSIGQGRVWAGSDAIAIGLVDQLGSLNDAVAKAAALAQLSDYSVVSYPAQKSFFEKLFDMKDDEVEMQIKSRLGNFYTTYEGLNDVLHAQGVQARIPAMINIQ